MNEVYEQERQAIITARKDNPKLSAWKLAKKLEIDMIAPLRTFYGLYSVIRRWDAKNPLQLRALRAAR